MRNVSSVSHAPPSVLHRSYCEALCDVPFWSLSMASGCPCRAILSAFSADHAAFLSQLPGLTLVVAPFLRVPTTSPQQTWVCYRSVLHCLANLLQFKQPDYLPDSAASLAFRHRSAVQHAPTAFRASWAADVFSTILAQLEPPQADSPSARSYCDACQRLHDLGFEWASSIAREGARLPMATSQPPVSGRARGNVPPHALDALCPSLAPLLPASSLLSLFSPSFSGACSSPGIFILPHARAGGGLWMSPRSACPRSGALRSRGGPLERATARFCSPSRLDRA